MTASSIRRWSVGVAMAAAAACALAWNASPRPAAPVHAADPVPAPGHSREAKAFVASQASPPAIDPAGPRGPGAPPGQALAYTTMVPCRILDTRVTGARVPANGTLDVRSVLADYRVQGGMAEGCGMDGVTPEAVVVNVTAVLPSGAGYATVFPYPGPRPLAASVNYEAGVIVNNTVMTKVDASAPGGQFRLYTYGASDYVIDLVGYYTLNTGRQRRLDCYESRIDRYAPSGQRFFYYTPTTCNAGFTLVAAQCQSLGSTATGYEGKAMIEWNTTGVIADLFNGQPRVACVGAELVPASAGSGSPVDVKERCCRIIEEPIPPPPAP